MITQYSPSEEPKNRLVHSFGKQAFGHYANEGAALKQGRIEMGLTVQEIADKIRVPTSLVEQMELGFDETDKLMAKYLEALGWEVSDLGKKAFELNDDFKNKIMTSIKS